MRRLGGAALLAAALAQPAFAQTSAANLVTASGAHKLEVELATTPKEREIGLMNRRSMPADHGMLFEFGQSAPVTMWMKNTLIPLDMLFLNERGEVTRIKERAQPESLDLIPSGGPVRYVLELNGGAAARYGVKLGDHLRHPAIAAGK
ncbi:hypothetical protein GCM10011390_06760 [Aureimonas endophytica]|uniref:DUF192 domain-containing protein n=1 Tax=Aureimonas endophytica TaxID=2027858 RepID=A0A916ZDL7_9HYPH|nr:DUF192 domain-containing protein [Aureimonas endophytica]GGD90647.1 hypothetical protein GCM10011390_06760 [Aureimonas endophytica]